MTRAQLRLLRHAARMPALGLDGVLAKGPQAKCTAALSKAGFLRYVGFGCDEEDLSGREWPIYEITDEGRAELARRASPGGAEGGGR